MDFSGKTITYSIAEEFSRTPGGRFRKNGPYSGEALRDDVLCGLLQEAIDSDSMLVIQLDGTSGYASAFLEEALGGLIRLRGFDRELVNRHLKIEALDPLTEVYRLSAIQYLTGSFPKV